VDIADSHTHLIRSGFIGRYGRPASGGDDLEIFESLRREHRIDTALVLGFEGDAEGDPHYRGNNAYVAGLATGPGWASPLAHAAPWLEHVPPALFRGVTAYLNSPAEAEWFARWAPRVGEQLAEREAIVSLNVTPETLAPATEAIRGLEGCQVLVSHLGQPGRYREAPPGDELRSALAPLLSLADAAHVGVKVSGLYDLTDPTHGYPHRPVSGLIERIAEAFGCNRLYWGSDFSPVLDHVSFAQAVHAVSDLPWSPGEREAVMGGNLRRILRRGRERRS
jgi:L-fuconolactonase